MTCWTGWGLKPTDEIHVSGDLTIEERLIQARKRLADSRGVYPRFLVTESQASLTTFLNRPAFPE